MTLMISLRGTPNTRPVLLLGDANTRLKELPAGSVQTCVTSPPYWGLRDYGVDNQLGLEATPEEYVTNLVSVFREVRRVLRDDGTVWLNLGDSYAGSGKGQMKDGSHASTSGSLQRTSKGTLSGGLPVDYKGLKPKDLVGAPWMVAFALRADGWYLRSDIVWSKPNPMPESVTDRPTKSHEYIFLLSKSARYYYDADAIKEASMELGATKIRFGGNKYGDSDDVKHQTKSGNRYTDAGTRNARSVWTFTTQPYPDAHFATFPEALPERCIKAGTSEKGVCPDCGLGWMRIVDKPKPPEWAFDKARISEDMLVKASPLGRSGKASGQKMQNWLNKNPAVTTGWQPQCNCGSEPAPAIVLDPFVGSGTTCAVAARLGRASIGIELNPEYLKLAQKRCLHGSHSIYDFDPNIYKPATNTQ